MEETDACEHCILGDRDVFPQREYLYVCHCGCLHFGDRTLHRSLVYCNGVCTVVLVALGMDAGLFLDSIRLVVVLDNAKYASDKEY